MATALIGILARCDVRQSTIAERLGVSRATVSHWASGARRMTRSHHDALLTWAFQAEQEALEAARAKDAAVPEPRSVLGGHRYTTELTYALQQLWHDYTWELTPTHFNAVVIALFRRWALYADANPETFTLKPEDLDRLWEDTRHIRAWIATQRRLHPETTHTEEEGYGQR